MSSIRQNKLQDLIRDGSQRVAFHQIIPYHRQKLHPLIKDHGQYVSYDRAIVIGLVLCRHCHQIFTNAPWNNKMILSHFKQAHHILGTEEVIPKRKSWSSTDVLPLSQNNNSNKGDESKCSGTKDVIINAEDELEHKISKNSEIVQATKKKRGRKPKVHTNGSIEQGKKKNVEKRLSKLSKGEVKVKKRKLGEEAKEKLQPV